MTAVALRPRIPMPQGLTNVSPTQWRVFTDAIFPSAKSAEAIVLALDYCRARNLDPFKKPVHIVPMYSREQRRYVETVWPGIGELEITAARTGEWAGMDEPKWGPLITKTFKGVVDDYGKHKQVEATLTYPESCSVTVYRLKNGQRYAYTEPVFWEEAYARQGRTAVPNETWQKRTRGQLHKCAKAASLRAAFPEDIGDYAAEEMEGKEIDAGGVVIEGSPVYEQQPRETESAAPADDMPPSIEEPAPPPPPRRTWKDLVDAIRLAAADCHTEEQVVAMGEATDVQRVYDHANENVQMEVSQILADALARVRGSDAGPAADTD